jgi:hypothetical protein
MLNGQASSISVGETRMFVTGLTVKAADEGFVYTPVVEPVSTGLSLAFQPFVSADGRLINLYVKAKVTSLDTEEVQYVPLVIPNGAGTAESAPFTQLLQMPRSTTLTADRPLALPDGGTALFVVGKRPCEVVERSKVPMLGDLPIVGELFSKVHRRPEVENVVMVVTPRLILDENEEAEACTKDGTCCHDRKTVAVPPPAIVEGQTGSPVFGSGLKAVKDARVGGITLPEGPSQTACAAPCCKDAACAAPCCKDCPTAKAGAPAVEEILLRAKMLAIRMKRPVGVYIDGNGQASEVILAEEAGSTPASVAQPRSGISCPAGSCCSAPCCKDCPAAATAAAGTDAKPAPRTAERVVRAEVVQIAHTQGDGVGFGRIEIAASEKRVSVSNNRFEATADRFTMTGKDEISLQGNVRLIWKGKSGPNEVRVDRADIQAKDGLMQIRLGD